MVVCMAAVRMRAHKDFMAREILLCPFQTHRVDCLSGEMLAFFGRKALDIMLILAATAFFPEFLGPAHLVQGLSSVVGAVLAAHQGVFFIHIGHDMRKAGPRIHGFNNCHSSSTSSWISCVMGGASKPALAARAIWFRLLPMALSCRSISGRFSTVRMGWLSKQARQNALPDLPVRFRRF